MKKDVLIHVRGLQMMDPEEEQEPIEIVVPGQYYYRNGSHYLRYEEMMDDTAEPTVNYIKMSAQGVEVRKQGQRGASPRHFCDRAVCGRPRTFRADRFSRTVGDGSPA